MYTTVSDKDIDYHAHLYVDIFVSVLQLIIKVKYVLLKEVCTSQTDIDKLARQIRELWQNTISLTRHADSSLYSLPHLTLIHIYL